MLNKLTPVLDTKLKSLEKEGRLKGKEKVIVDIVPPGDGFGRKIVMSDKRTLLNFASNSYLGIGNDPRLIKAAHEADLKFGVGPGAMIFSSAYAANCGIIAPLVDKDTYIISDELNHNSIIMAIRFAGVPRDRKKIYAHCDMDKLRKCIDESVGNGKRLIIVTDGVFSMRGDYAPLHEIACLAEEYYPKFEEGIMTVVDDSHGIGAYGKTGRGTVEVTQEDRIDIITATLGKGLGVDGGFIVSNEKVIEYLRETSPLYVYSNPIGSGVASAALKALEILDSHEGLKLLERLRENTEYFRKGINQIGFKTIEGIHPIVPILIGDSIKAKQMVSDLYQRGIYVVALTYPVVPRGQDTIRVQILASHTRHDLDYALRSFREAGKKKDILE
jgi:glycine C-acetyltransferase